MPFYELQPLFLVMLAFGATTMGATIIPLSIDDSIASEGACSIACMAALWLLTVGWTITFAVLFIKLFRVNQLMQNARRFRRVQVKAYHVMLPLAFLLSINVFLMLVWTLLDPMYWVRTETGELSSYGICKLGRTQVSAYMFGAVVLLNFCALVLALIEAFKARNLNDSLSESKYIFFIFGSMLQIGVVGVPLIALVAQDPVASYFVKSALVFVLCMSTLLLIFVPKMRNWQQGYSTRALTTSNRARQSSRPRDGATSSNQFTSGGGPSGSHQFTHIGARLAPSSSVVHNETTLSSAAIPNGDDVDGLGTRPESSIEPLVTIPLSKIAELEVLLKQRGIETDSLFEAVELDTLLQTYRADTATDCRPKIQEEMPPDG